jgi:hypothetical protein
MNPEPLGYRYVLAIPGMVVGVSEETSLAVAGEVICAERQALVGLPFLISKREAVRLIWADRAEFIGCIPRWWTPASDHRTRPC